MTIKIGFRGLTSAQCSIVEYWESRRATETLPYRHHIDPGALRSHLSDISIVEIDPQGEVVFRVVGSGLRSVLGRNVQGHALSTLDGSVADMFTLGLSTALSRQLPAGGIIDRQNDRHAWLRLPLLDQKGGVSLVLCHDHLLKRSGSKSDISYTISNIKPGIAA